MALTLSKQSRINGATASLWLPTEINIDPRTQVACTTYGLFNSQQDYDNGLAPLDSEPVNCKGAAYAAYDVPGLLTTSDTQAKIDADEFFKDAT